MIFPFTAIVGQDQMKMGLILNVIDPTVGGLLIMGEKGTGKSTAVRALAELLPELQIASGCPFNCDPSGNHLCSHCREKKAGVGELKPEKRRMKVVELPLGITEDRLIGTLDVEHALKRGEKRFDPGILADANRNFLYVDEVNLLEDHIIDLLLDSAAMGNNTVEREGVSFSHPARFILVGTMNPEEGDLRPQLLDRFGLSVTVHSIMDRNSRIEILRRRAAFDADPERFANDRQREQTAVSQSITRAREALPEVTVTDEILDKVVDITTDVRTDGHRADIVILRAARALASLRGRKTATVDDLRDIAPLALGHRLKRLPFEELGLEAKRLEEAVRKVCGSTAG